ncbi:hypothetical protein F5Y15DRAFT_418599 [Xylariaceae sp. FL0016]|nr:hypothetical protein F5Y15DRAFT_418599 [Xylariaceae sp. FL0016]
MAQYARLRSVDPLPTPKTVWPKGYVRQPDQLPEGNAEFDLPPRKKKRETYSAAALLEKDKRTKWAEYQPPHKNSRRPSPFPGQPQLPEHPNPLVDTLHDKFSHYTSVLHAKGLNALDEVQNDVSTQVVANVRAQATEACRVFDRDQYLRKTLLDSVVVLKEDNTSEKEVVMKDAIASFEERLTTTTAELEQLWNSWENTQTAIDALHLEMAAGAGDDNTRKTADLATGASGMSPSPSHKRAVEGFIADLDKSSKEVVEEMTLYEKEFLKKINHEASGIIQSFLGQ